MLQLDWDATINLLRQTLPQTQFVNWVKPVEFIRCKENSVVLGVPSRFHEEWLRNNYFSQISQAIRDQCGSELQLEFEILETVKQNVSAADSMRHEPSATALVPTAIRSIPIGLVPKPEPIETPQLPVFHHPFFTVASNQVAAQCAAIFVDGRDLQLNPLVVLSGVGLGKTHLLSQIGTRLHARRPNLRIRFVSAESFTSEMTRHFKSNDLLSFKRKYAEQTDCLLFDNVHELTRRTKTQETLLHIFNDIIARGGYIAFSTAVAPHRLEEFLEPLRSRLLSGMLAEIDFPSHECKISLLEQMAAHNGIVADPMALRTIADKRQNDVRELVGALLRAHLQAKLQDRPLDSSFVSNSDWHPEPPREVITMPEIVSLVEHAFGISRIELTSKSRKGTTVWARQVAMYLARMYTLLPLEEIGKALGRDHATVIHAFRKVTETLETQPTRRYEVEFLKRKLEARVPRPAQAD